MKTTRETFEDCQLARLGEANKAHLDAREAKITAETKRAIYVEPSTGIFSDKGVWLPRSEVASRPTKHNGLVLCIKRSWLAKERLWWLTN